MVVDYTLIFLVLLPALAAFTLCFLPSNATKLIHITNLIFSLLSLAVIGYIASQFDGNSAGFQFLVQLPWMPQVFGNPKISLGVDGISLGLIVLTHFLSLLIFIALPKTIHKNFKSFSILYHGLQFSMVGSFAALDLLLFYFFWEFMLIPMYFMIGFWGGQNRIYATVKFFIFTLSGSLLMLISFITMAYFNSKALGNGVSLYIPDFKTTMGLLPNGIQMLLFWGITLAFMIKVPVFPFHSWLPDAHVQAPTVGSVILAGTLLKMGTYGLLRFSLCLFPKVSQQMSIPFIVLGIVGIIYGALIAWRQTDIKKLIAYSSVSHMGFIVAGLFSLTPHGINGALYQMVNHGITTGGLFFLIGFLYERTHTREMDQYGGLVQSMPWFSFYFVFMTFAAVALPGTGSFIGEWLILLGVFQAQPLLAIFAGLGVVLGAIYMLWLVLNLIWGPKGKHSPTDLTPWEHGIMAVLCLCVVALGFGFTKTFAHAQPTLFHLYRTLVLTQ